MFTISLIIGIRLCLKSRKNNLEKYIEKGKNFHPELLSELENSCIRDSGSLFTNELAD